MARLGYEPADLTVHTPPPPKTIEGGFIFFAYVSSPTKFFFTKKKWILFEIFALERTKPWFYVITTQTQFQQG